MNVIAPPAVVNPSSMNVTRCELEGLVILEPKVFGDERGFLFESFNRRRFAELTGRDVDFVQDNHSCSAKNVLRGLHYQIQQPQGKLVRVVQGAVFDVAVDIRRSSPTFPHRAGVSSTKRTAQGTCVGAPQSSWFTKLARRPKNRPNGTQQAT